MSRKRNVWRLFSRPCASSMGEPDGRPQGLPVLHRSANPFGSSACLAAGVLVFQTELEHNMTAPHALTVGTVAIRQHNGLYALNDLHKAAGGEEKHRPGYFLGLDQTQALIAELETAGIPAVSTKEGRNGGTFASRELVIAYAAWISPAFHLKVIRVFLDSIAPANTPPALPAPDLASDWQADPGNPPLSEKLQYLINVLAEIEVKEFLKSHAQNAEGFGTAQGGLA